MSTNHQFALLKTDFSRLSTRAMLIDIFQHLSIRRKFQLSAALILMMASGLAEVCSLAAVMPFLSVLSDPQRLWQFSRVQSFAILLGISDPSELLFPATVIFILTAILAGSVRLINLWFNGRLAAVIGSDLSCEAYERTLYQPYAIHLERNSSSIITSIANHTSEVVVVTNASLQLVTSAVVSFALLAALIFINWLLACIALLIFGLAYAFISLATRRQLSSNSRRVADLSQLQLQILQEGLGAIRDVLLDSNQTAYLDIYRKADRPKRLLQARSIFLGNSPRYGLEALGIVLIALLALLLSLRGDSSISIITVLGAFALGSQRLLPAMQQVYSNWSIIQARQKEIANVLDLLGQTMPAIIEKSAPLHLKESIVLKDLSFCYTTDSPLVLDKITLRIQQGDRIGLIGSTGSGKSTLSNLLMGLLTPSQGQIIIDGIDLHNPGHADKISSWRSSIAHVPQNIFLADSSITENIAFGIPKEKIDIDRVHRAAQQAQISSFIESSVNGYNTFVGERGVRLSGGQRQRIGIARALYKQANVIVLDEATSALDVATEEEVMRALEALSRDLTIIMVAHRLSTVQRCDRLIYIDKGSIFLEGSPDFVIKQIQ